MKKIFPNKFKEYIVFIVGNVLNILAMLLYLFVPLIIKEIIDFPLLGKEYAIRLCLIFLSNILLHLIAQYMLISYSERKIKSIRYHSLDSLLRVKIENFKEKLSGELSSRVLNDTETIRMFLVNFLPNALGAVVFITISFVILFRLDVKLSLAMIGGLIILLLLLMPLSMLGGKFSKKRQGEQSKLSGFLTEVFQHIQLIKERQAFEEINKRHLLRLEEYYKYALHYSFLDAIIQPVVLLALIVIIAAIFLYGGSRVAQGTLSIGTLISFLIYLFQLLTPLSSIGQFLNSYSKSKASLMILDSYQLLPSEYSSETVIIREAPSSIVLDKVSYIAEDSFILNKVSFELKKGRSVAIVGPSGAGKTTLLNVISKLYQEYEGAIMVDKNELRNIDLTWWRNQISIVSQGYELFSGTIYENLVFGLDTLPTDKEIEAVLKQVNIAEEIKQLEYGMNTVLGENGAGLSGGQRQRLQIARSLLKKASIYIFDEATANLDVESEHAVIEAINTLVPSKIVIFITHKLTSIRNVQQIVFIKDGCIVAIGSHSQLMSESIDYKRFIETEGANKLL